LAAERRTKAVVYRGKDDLRLEEIPIPEPGAGGRCSSGSTRAESVPPTSRRSILTWGQ